MAKANSNSKSTTKSKATKKEIQGKAIGRNVILNIDNKKYTKVVPIKEDRDAILAKVIEYNKKNTIKLEKEIIGIMLENKTTETERKEQVKKANKAPKVKKEEKPKVSKPTQAQIEKAKKLLEQDGYTVSKTAPPSSRRRGEY